MIVALFLAGLLSLMVTGCTTPKSQPSLDAESLIDLQIIHIIEPDQVGDRPLNSPRGVAVNQAGEIYIADYGNDRLVMLDSTYQFIREVGGFGAGDYVLSGPVDLAIDKVSNVYVVDSGNRRIVRYDRRLNFISSESGFTKEEKINFIRPLSLEISPRGDILFGDEGLGACFKLDQFFNYIYEFGGRDEIYSVIYPSSIEYYDNRIYVTDADYGYLLIYDDFGMMLGKLGQDDLREPTSVAVSPKTGFWVTDRSTRLLHGFNFKGLEIFRWNGQGQSRLGNPSDIFIDHNGRLYVTDSNTSRIYVLRPVTGN